jgi:Ca2+-binding RTX toxin-like protein
MCPIRIASNFIDGAWYASGTFADFGHLQIVFGDLEIEVQAPNPVSIPFGGSWVVEPVRSHSLNSTNYLDPLYYASTEIVLADEQTDSYLWELLIQIRESFASNSSIDYNYSQNSNSYVRTLLYIVGVDLDQYLNELTLPSMDNGFPGAERNILFDRVGSSDLITLNITGTSGNDNVNAGFGNDWLGGGDGNDTIKGSAGHDTINGGQGLDSLYGGNNDDLLTENFDLYNEFDGGNLFGGKGHDTIDVRISVDTSTLFGGSGNDTLKGNGASVLYGGSGIDEFRIITTSTDPSASGDTIVGQEGLNSP